VKIKLLSLCILLLAACEKSSFAVGNCLIPNDKTSPTSIIRLVSISTERVLFFSHFFNNGKLFLAEDYQKTTLDEARKNYSLIECPITEGVFSPDKFINQK